MSNLLKRIDIPNNVRKSILGAGSIPTCIELYDDKVVAVNKKKNLEWPLNNIYRIEFVPASFISNNEFAIIFFVSPTDENNAKYGRTRMISKPDTCFCLCSGKFSYDAANSVGKQLFDELSNWLETHRTDGGIPVDDSIYRIEGLRGKHLIVYDNKVIIKTGVTVDTVFRGTADFGEKTIFYSDVLGVQFKPCGLKIGYLQLETASSQTKYSKDHFDSENSFPFGYNVEATTMEEVVNYIKDRVEAAHKISNSSTIVHQTKSPVEQIKELKELLDMGIITQDEFDVKKKQLLGL